MSVSAGRAYVEEITEELGDKIVDEVRKGKREGQLFKIDDITNSEAMKAIGLAGDEVDKPRIPYGPSLCEDQYNNSIMWEQGLVNCGQYLRVLINKSMNFPPIFTFQPFPTAPGGIPLRQGLQQSGYREH